MVVNLHLLDACNFRCAQCFAHFEAKKVLSCGQWKAIVDNILDSMDVERFNLTGGEPLLYSSLPELAGYIRSRGSAVSIISNGYSLSPGKIHSLGKCGVSPEARQRVISCIMDKDRGNKVAQYAIEIVDQKRSNLVFELGDLYPLLPNESTSDKYIKNKVRDFIWNNAVIKPEDFSGLSHDDDMRTRYIERLEDHRTIGWHTAPDKVYL